MFKLLVAADGSHSALKGAEFASTLCNQIADCEITVIHVLDAHMLAMAQPRGMDMSYSSVLYRDLERMSNELLEHARQRFEVLGHKVATRTETGSPAQVICEVAEKEGFNLVVMGHSGTGRFAHMLLGSVVDKVAHICTVPLVIVRSKEHED
jgi:nucleotide-binding universal stress UspA family protein